MSNLIFNNAAFVNTDTYASCVKLQPSTNYTDTIYRNTAYTGQTTKVLKVVNSCVTAFTVPSQNIFTDTLQGGDFVASVLATNILGNSTVDVPVSYMGTYKGSNNNPVYGIALNGSSASYSLTVLTPDTAPVTQDSIISLTNRQNTVVTKSNLLYTDADGIGTVTHVRFTGTVNRLFTDAAMTQAYVAGTELLINSFQLYYKASNQDAADSYQVQYNVKASDVWSS